MDAETRRFVRERAELRCEYCHISEASLERSLHVEHVVAKQHGGSDDRENLALACDRRNLHKGPNLSAIDSLDGQVVLLFHPRRDVWQTHFFRNGPRIEGRTSVGRATVQLLQMNTPRRLRLREQID